MEDFDLQFAWLLAHNGYPGKLQQLLRKRRDQQVEESVPDSTGDSREVENQT